MPDNDQTIIQLDKKTIDKIAAGEVIERPASVVKELVENSIDAQATEISIFVKGFGLEEIVVIDNGFGMSKKDALIAWKSHTTSKLKKIEDLDKITSLGFRGEALASIAAISTLEIITKRKNDQLGTIVRVKGGDVELVEERQCNIVTTVSVKNLFYNVPARKKFLKTKATELGHLIEIIHTYALIQPAIHFKFTHNNQELLNSPKSSNPLDPFIAIYGADVAKEMIKIEYEQNGISINGYTSQPKLSRASRDFELLYVNKRGIKSKLISEAIEEAYKTLLMKKRFPITLINISINSSDIDINIHPTKKEIRFKDPKNVFEAVKNAVIFSLQSSS